MTQIDPLHPTGHQNFELSKIRHFEIEKSLYLSNGLTDRREVWHGIAYCPSKLSQ